MKFRNLYLIEVFHAVMKTGSMTGAARLLNLSQPSVSKYIQILESSIGAELFVRDGRGISPTATAIIMYEDVHALFDQANSIYRIMESVSRTSRRTIRIGMPPLLGSRFVADVLAHVGRDHQDFDINVVVKDSEILKNWVNSGRLDLAIVHDLISGGGVNIAKAAMICIMPAGHSLCDRDCVEPGDLLNHDYVGFESDSPMQSRVDRLLREVGVKIYPRAVVTTTPTLVELVGVGIGISVVHPFALIDAHTPVAWTRFSPDIFWDYRVISSSTLRNSYLVTEFLQAIESVASMWLRRLSAPGALSAGPASVP
ncbi:DNA-binding transcriptional LysR family regulator [Rhizobium leguminosarum]|uniref:DNA-binding transcriptional LysR family regulator n=1 Tax=Rhizobium leguminosarum TaxID=384 RepID=A0AAE2SXH2_RHILE|nr:MULTISPECIES: LysR family transcriptional regulator [Rhizobium]MBB4291430.1 DNA-binding transcriptional LysR family regulator [Rhizobium leguminosarum]MBB4296126.1 DNA-binding transcriptional LysR family regulator [Rhizobium leguminosarum]MBB4308615.1 DNA-binding transcriptional LysR family regulator [Rhizobium leguminosarum]MBB4416450.1 DNA-binding transcriptional LysR family regulator [Rhizobium leguminosarum]MBB4430583.1 DNA-binding transcriptional LysR family regulator [Rhizobium espera